MTNLDIAQQATLRPIAEIAERAGLTDADYEPYGRYRAKLSTEGVANLLKKPAKAKVVLVTAINPTPSGEGKTTTSVGLAQGLNQIGKAAMPALREPALGPVFGVKGGACGGGYSQVLPMEEINLFFNGDFPAITAAHNLLSAMVDAHLHHGNAEGLDTTRIWWPRTVDMIDRSLREMVVGLGKGNGPVRSDGFVITPASEIMAIFCLAADLSDLKERLGRIVVGLRRDNSPVLASQIGGVGAMAALLRDAVRPNLVQTMEGGPAIIHGGPFGNIAHGCSSLIGSKCALRLTDYMITEGGFGSDLGGEKYLDIVTPQLGVNPSAIVVVATVRALKHHGGGDLKEGVRNLGRHIDHARRYGPPVIVSINQFKDDTQEDLDYILGYARDLGANAVLANPWGAGGPGCVALAEQVAAVADDKAPYQTNYQPADPIDVKVEKVVKQVYGGAGVSWSPEAKKRLEWLDKNGYGGLPVCIAKTQYSLSDDPTLLAAPSGFTVKVREAKLSAGAGFVVVVCGEILLMPGMGKTPAAAKIDLLDDGTITGLF